MRTLTSPYPGPGILKRINRRSSWQNLGRPHHFGKGDFWIYTDSSCIIACVSSWVSEIWLNVFKAWTAFISRNSTLNWAMAEASVREGRLLAGPGARAKPSVSVGTLCEVLRVSPKLGKQVTRQTERLTGNLASDVNQNKSSPRQRPTITAVGQGSHRRRRRTMLTDNDDRLDRSAVGQLSSLSSRTKWQRLPAGDTLRPVSPRWQTEESRRAT